MPQLRLKPVESSLGFTVALAVIFGGLFCIVFSDCDSELKLLIVGVGACFFGLLLMILQAVIKLRETIFNLAMQERKEREESCKSNIV